MDKCRTAVTCINEFMAMHLKRNKMKSKQYILLAFISLCSTNLKINAQILPEWSVSHPVNVSFQTMTNEMVSDLAGNIYISGYISDTSGNSEAILLKYNTDGIFQWENIYDSTHYFNQVALDNDSNVYMVGTKFINGSQIYLVKYDASGIYQWDQLYNIGPSNYGFDVTVDDSGYVIVGGITNVNLFTTLKYDGNGNLMWEAFDSTVGGLSFSYVTTDEHCNVYYAGRAQDTSYRAKIFKYNSSGNKQWETSYGGNYSTGLAEPKGITYRNGYVYLATGTNNNINAQGDYAIVKYDSTGNFKWDAIYSASTYYDVPEGIDVDNWGNSYVTGWIFPYSCSSDEYATLKLDSTGAQKWVKTYSSTPVNGNCNTDRPRDVTIDSLGYIYITGESPDSLGTSTFTTIKYDSSGNELWVAKFHNSSLYGDYAKSVSVDLAGNIYVAGSSFDAISNSITAIKYSFYTNVPEIDNNSPTYSVSPNPFIDYFNIYSKSSFDNAVLILYDPTGRMILREKLPIGNSFLIQRGNLEKGMYFYELLQGQSITVSGKIIAQ